ncbi:TonB-dependent siderophore receptor [Marinomonas algicola]|uniref:TonB-dependent siderophore receptor n=1 Tax=Marinomonas algicola TaxID=2773454 RepID=UPI00174A0427|nr:TonB-dependent siderophore receptor [Marinomonas algicola]
MSRYPKFAFTTLFSCMAFSSFSWAENQIRLSTLSVEGNQLYQEAASEESESYTMDGATVGSKTPATLRDIPQSVSVVAHQSIEDQNADTLEEIAENTPGLRMLPNERGRSSVIARGYKYSEYNVDGLPAQMESRLGTMPNLAAFDRIEIMRGPSGLFDASGEMGGIINLIRKRGTDEFQGKSEVSLGTNKQYEAGLDIGSPLNEDGRIRGRLVINGFGETPEETGKAEHHETVYAAFDVDLDNNTTLGLGFLHQERDLTPNNGLPLDSEGNLLSLPNHDYYAPSWNRFNMQSDDLFADLSHYFTNGGYGKVGIRYRENSSDWNYMYAGSAISPTDSVIMLPYASDVAQKAFVADASYSQPFDFMGSISEFVFGADYKRFEDDRREYKSRTGTSVSVSNLSNIAYYDIFSANGSSSYSNVEREETGLYGKITLRPVSNLALIAGARASQWDITTINKRTNSTTTRSDDKAIWYGGAVYDLDDSYSLYASVSELYIPQEYVDGNGEVLDPREGKQVELGIKSSYLNDALQARISLYQIDDKNAWGVNSSREFIATGKRRMQGAEVEVIGQITKDFKVIAGYSYIDTDIIEESSYDVLISYMPEHMFNLWGSYQVNETVNMGLGLNTLSKIENDSGADASAYKVVNAMMSYQFTPELSAQLNIDNLLNERYYARVGDSGQFNIPGAERSAKATIRYQF